MTPDSAGALAIVLLAANLLAVAGSTVQLLCLRRLCTEPLLLGVFLGPRLWEWEPRPGLWVRVNLIPAGSYVGARSDDEEASPGGGMPASWGRRPRGLRAVVLAANAVVLLLIGLLLLGPERFVDSAAGAPAQLARGALAPLTTGKALAEGFLAELSRTGPLGLAGVLAAKLGVVHLLPLPALPGGQIVTTLLTGQPDGSSQAPAWLGHVSCLGGLVSLALAVPWAVAFGAASWG